MRGRCYCYLSSKAKYVLIADYFTSPFNIIIDDWKSTHSAHAHTNIRIILVAPDFNLSEWFSNTSRLLQFIVLIFSSMWYCFYASWLWRVHQFMIQTSNAKNKPQFSSYSWMTGWLVGCWCLCCCHMKLGVAYCSRCHLATQMPCKWHTHTHNTKTHFQFIYIKTFLLLHLFIWRISALIDAH